MSKTKSQQKNWQKNKLEDLLNLIIDYRGKTPKKLGSDWSDTGIPALSAKNIKDSRIVNRNAIKYVDEELYKKWMKEELRRLDVLLTSEAPLGETYLLTEDQRYCLSQRLFALRADQQKISPYFLYYFLKSTKGQGELIKRGTGSTVSGIRQSALMDVKITYPESTSKQEKIGKTLFNYDELIENNTRRIQILEELAQAIYKEWFVHFRFPGYEKVKMVDSKTEFGKIPWGWKAFSLRKVISDYIGGGWGKENPDEKHSKTAYVIRGTDIPNVRRGDISTTPLRYHKESNLRSRSLSENSIVFEVSGGSKGQPVGRTVLITNGLLKQFDSEVMGASFCKLIKPAVEKVSPFHLYQQINDWYENGVIEKYQVQSTGISNFRFESFIDEEKIVLPSESVRNDFDNLVSPIFEEIHLLGWQGTKLRQARDLFLPKLVTGEIEI